MKSHVKVLIWIILPAALLYGAYQGFLLSQDQNNDSDVAAMHSVETPAVEVVVDRVRTGTIQNDVRVTGEVRPLRSVDVVPKIAGHLERLKRPNNVLIEEGVSVEKGELVAIIEHEQLKAALHSAAAVLDVSKAAHEAAKVNLADALREKDRWINLRKKGSGTDQQRDQAVTAFKRADAQLKQSSAQIAQAQAALEQAKVNLDDATIKSPISGVVSRKYVDEGAFVGPATPLFKVINIDQVEISGGVADRYYPKLLVGKTWAQVAVDAYPNEHFKGFVTRVRPELDTVTRTVTVTIQVPNDGRKLKPGMYAQIRLILDERKDVVLIADDALLRLEEKPLVYVVKNGVVHRRDVEIGLEEGDLNEIRSGLTPGEQVVIRGLHLLKDGMKVKTQEADQS